MATMADSVKARIERMLKARFSGELEPFASHVISAGHIGAIDDGDYGDPMQDTTPDFVRKDNQGWVSLTTFKR